MSKATSSTSPQLSLDDQIALAEHAVIARDLRIRQRADALVHHVRRQAIRHAGGGALVGVVTVAVTWWINRLLRRHAPPPSAAPAAAAETAQASTCEHLFRDISLTLASLLPVVWPLVPTSWRRSVSPRMAGSALTFVGPLLGKLFRRKPRATRGD